MVSANSATLFCQQASLPPPRALALGVSHWLSCEPMENGASENGGSTPSEGRGRRLSVLDENFVYPSNGLDIFMDAQHLGHPDYPRIDSYIKLSTRENDKQSWRELTRTEVVQDASEPNFASILHIPARGPAYILIELFQVIKSSELTPTKPGMMQTTNKETELLIGRCGTKLHNFLHHTHGFRTRYYLSDLRDVERSQESPPNKSSTRKKESEGPALNLSVFWAEPGGKIAGLAKSWMRISLKAAKLPKNAPAFSYYFIEVYREPYSQEGALDLVHRSKPLRDSLNYDVQFQPFALPGRYVRGPDGDPLHLKLTLNRRLGSSSERIGEMYTTIQELLDVYNSIEREGLLLTCRNLDPGSEEPELHVVKCLEFTRGRRVTGKPDAKFRPLKAKFANDTSLLKDWKCLQNLLKDDFCLKSPDIGKLVSDRLYKIEETMAECNKMDKRFARQRVSSLPKLVSQESELQRPWTMGSDSIVFVKALVKEDKLNQNIKNIKSSNINKTTKYLQARASMTRHVKEHMEIEEDKRRMSVLRPSLSLARSSVSSPSMSRATSTRLS